MKNIIITVMTALLSCAMPAQNLVWMKTGSVENIKNAFADTSLTIHYYTDDFVIATTADFDTRRMTLLDKNAFSGTNDYYLIYCPQQEQAKYQEQNKKTISCLMENDHYMIIKPLAGKITPYLNDGTVAIDQQKARLVEQKIEFPELTEEEPNIRALMMQMSRDSLLATIEHMQNYSSREYDNDTVYMAEEWLKKSFEKLGLEVYKHDFEFETGGSMHETSDNIIAVQRGTKYPDEYVICGAHYDSYSRQGKAPGADDNASGTAGILETARILSKYSFERSILYCGWAAEEVGLKGSEAFASQAEADSMNIIAYFNLDMSGYLQEDLELRIDMIYVTLSNPLAEFYKNMCNTYYPSMKVIRNWLVNGDSDHSSFHRHGFMSIFPFERVETRSPYIHTSNDTIGLSVNNMDQTLRYSEMNLACVATLAGYVGGTNVNEIPIGLHVYPNPADDSFNVKYDNLKSIFVYDNLGRQIKTIDAKEGSECQVRTSDWIPGMYILQIVALDGKLYRHKVVIK